MLPRPGLGDHAMLPHPLDQQPLPQAVVDLVRPGVQQILALQINLRPAQLLRQPPRKKQRRRTPRISPQQFIQPRLKFLIALRLLVLALQVRRAPPSESQEHTARRKPQTALAHSREQNTRRQRNPRVPHPSRAFAARVGTLTLVLRGTVAIPNPPSDPFPAPPAQTPALSPDLSSPAKPQHRKPHPRPRASRI